MYRNTYVEINIDNLEYNIVSLIKKYNDYDYYFGIVKSSCYGHSNQIIPYLINSGINYLAVSSLEEALKIRKINMEIPILCLEPIDLEYIDKCITNNITITVCDKNYFEQLEKIKITKTLKIHLKIDSGMSRLGLLDSEEVRLIEQKIKREQYFYLEGIYTHFSNNKRIQKQIDNFLKITSLIDLKKIPIVHLGKSGTLVNHEKITFANGIRLGIIMYGYNPNDKYENNLIKKDYDEENIYKPAFTLYSEIIQIKKIKKGSKIGYNGSYTAKDDIIIGIIPVGYADGYLRTNKNSYVVIDKKRYQVIGDVSMGMIAVKIDSTIKMYDKVILIGKNISALEVAHKNNTIVYEVLCLIQDSVPRVLVKNNKIIEIVERS